MTTTKAVRKTTPAKKAASVRPDAAAPKSTRTAPKAPIAEVSAKETAASSTKPKQKLVRDSFTIPKAEYAVLEGLKLRAANLKRPTKKSELLRAGIATLGAMSDKAFLAALGSVASLKTGRPKGSVAND